MVFEYGATHLYSVDLKGDVPPDAVVITQQVDVALSAVRVFSLARARLMDRVLPAISDFTVSIIGKRGNKVLHGPQLPSGEYMRVVLRRAPNMAWLCVSAFPVQRSAYLEAWNSKRAKFPP